MGDLRFTEVFLGFVIIMENYNIRLKKKCDHKNEGLKTHSEH